MIVPGYDSARLPWLLVGSPHCCDRSGRRPVVRGTEIGPGFVQYPAVLRRDAIPVVTDLAEAVRRPELGVLSAMAHGDTEQGATIAAAVLPAIQGLDDDRARLYYDLVYNSLNAAARRELEAIMKGYEYQTDFAKKSERLERWLEKAVVAASVTAVIDEPN